jgi:NADPH-dependent 2,4-dienoyl-CoA reductase/sulfur reductase-like enzyme/nitrite reductase/ring-hydroxylating ferredoxin subunit
LQEDDMADTQTPGGPDLAGGVPLSDLGDGHMLAGHVGEDQVLLARVGQEVFAVGAQCSHYHGPLADGLLVGDTVRCPWHHACFSLRTGEALRTPAFGPLDCWSVEQRDGKVFVKDKRSGQAAVRVNPAGAPGRMVIVGGGAAGFAAAEMLRRQQYGGSIVMLSDDSAAPVDRPNLSKDYLAGNAPEEWVPLQSHDYYAEKKIDLRLGTSVASIDRAQRQVVLGDGSRISYDRLLLATGAEPVRLATPGFDQPHVHTLRSLADSRAIIERAKAAKRALVIGASFIGLEVAASLRHRQIEVHVVAPEKVPMARVAGTEIGTFVRTLHEEHGVVFHLEDTVSAIDGARATLKSGRTLDADLVVVGVGVRPRLALAEAAGLALDRGVSVDAYLQTSDPNIFAAGDIARWPDPHCGQAIRVEHWVVAERQGQAAALNMLGAREKFEQVPFFWSQHYDVPINYVGHAERWGAIEVDGDIRGRDCVVRFKQDGRTLAVASIYRDVASLQAELAMERDKPTR